MEDFKKQTHCRYIVYIYGIKVQWHDSTGICSIYIYVCVSVSRRIIHTYIYIYQRTLNWRLLWNGGFYQFNSNMSTRSLCRGQKQQLIISPGRHSLSFLPNRVIRSVSWVTLLHRLAFLLFFFFPFVFFFLHFFLSILLPVSPLSSLCLPFIFFFSLSLNRPSHSLSLFSCVFLLSSFYFCCCRCSCCCFPSVDTKFSNNSIADFNLIRLHSTCKQIRSNEGSCARKNVGNNSTVRCRGIERVYVEKE